MSWTDWTAIAAIFVSMCGVLGGLALLWIGPPPRGRRSWKPSAPILAAVWTLLIALPASVILWAVTLIGVILHAR